MAKKKIKKSAKKPAGKKTVKKATKPKGPKVVGKITHVFDKISVAIIKVQSPLKVGDYIQIKGHVTDFKQKVDSIQINHKNVPMVNKGAEIGLKVGSHVRENDVVYAAEPETQLAIPLAPQLPQLSPKPIMPMIRPVARPAVPPSPKPIAPPPPPKPSPAKNPYDNTKFFKF